MASSRATVDQVLAATIREEIKATGMTQQSIAFRLGYSEQALSDRLRGRTRWTAVEIPVVCQLIGITPTQLYNKAALG